MIVVLPRVSFQWGAVGLVNADGIGYCSRGGEPCILYSDRAAAHLHEIHKK